MYIYIYVLYNLYILYIYNVSLTSPVPSSGFPRPQLVAGLMLGPVLPSCSNSEAFRALGGALFPHGSLIQLMEMDGKIMGK